MIEVEAPDGTVIEFPDGTDAGTIKSVMSKQFGGQPSMAMDALKTAPSAVARGITTAMEMPGAMKQLVDSGVEGLGRMVGVEPGQIPEGVTPGFVDISPPGAGAVTGALEDVVGPLYQPQTTLGEYVNTVGEFAPLAVTSPGSVVQKALMATVPAIASETAGQLTKDTAWEPWARAGGALAGGLVTAGHTSAVKEAAKGAPTREAIKQQTDDIYGALRNAGIRYDDKAFANAVVKAENDLIKAGFRPSVAREAFSLIDDLGKQAGAPDFDDINGLVQMVGGRARDATRAGDGTLAKALGIIRDNLDDFERAAPLVGNANMPRDAINQMRGEARKTALRNIKARALDDVVANAETYQSGVESGIRNQISNLVRSKRGKQLFNSEERTALLQVAQGRKTLQTLSRFGIDPSIKNLSGKQSLLPAMAGGAAYMEPTVGIPLLAAGTVAKVASPRMTQNALANVQAAMRSGKLTNQQATQEIKKLIAEQAARRALTGGMAYQAVQ